LEPLRPGKLIRPKVKEYIKACMQQGMTRDQAKEQYRLNGTCKCYRNSTYVVLIYKDFMPHWIWLSIRRDDRMPIHDWRDLQDIKNQLVGAEHEGVELYPAESRKVDTANQYHLFVSTDPTFRYPFGYQEREVSDAPFLNSKQRTLNA